MMNRRTSRIVQLTGADPAVGDEIILSVPPREIWLVHSLVAGLSAGAGGSSRLALLRFKNGLGATFATAQHGGSGVPGGTSNTFSWALHVEQTQSILFMHALPFVYLLPGFTLETQTINKLATDNWGAPELLLEKWAA